MINAILLLAVVLVISPTANADIFKCVNEKKLTVYQNFPCEFDARGSLSTMPPPQKAAEVQTASPKMAGGTVRPVASTAGPASAADGKTPRVGMTRAEVRRQGWGRPSRISRDRETQAEIWTYDANRVVWFDSTGHVSAVQR